jgi:hypothetical protein
MDTDKGLSAFYDSCSLAGPSLCAFHAESSGEIHTRLDNLIASVKKNPVPVSKSTLFGIVDYSAVKTVMLLALFDPAASFKLLAEQLYELEMGDGESVLRMVMSLKAQCGCKEEMRLPSLREVTDAIRCSDGEVLNDTVADLERYFQAMARTSSFADLWSSIRVGCTSVYILHLTVSLYA